MHAIIKPFAFAVLAAGLVLGSVPLARNAHAGDEAEAAKSVLAAYKSAIERLDGDAATALFAPDSRIFEQGGDEGSWENYLAHHLGPEFGEFKSLTFHDYRVSVSQEGGLAYGAETYRYTIVLAEGGEPIERLGAATSVLRKTEEGWKIVQYHSSSRKPPSQ